MLQRAEVSPGETNLRELWEGLRRRRWLIGMVTLTSMVGAAVVLAFSTPRFESEATLRIITEDRSGGLLGSLPSIAQVALPGMGTEEIDTELGVLRSRRIAEAVVDSLDLQVELVEPRIARDSVLRVLQAPRDARAGTYTYERLSGGDFALVEFETERAAPRTARAAIGEQVRLGDVSITLAPSLAGTEHDRISIAVHPFQQTVDRLREELVVEKQEGASELVEVSYRAPHPGLAASVVDAVVDTYLAYTASTSRQELRKRVDTLNDQVASYERQLARAEEQMRDYRERFQIIDPQEQATQQVRLLAEVTAEREQAMIERQSLMRLLREVEQDDGTRQVSPYRKLAAFPSFITNQGVQAMLESLNELEDARSELLLLRTPENADVRRIDERIAQLEGQLYRLATDYLQTLENQIASADASLARSGSSVEVLPQRELAYARLLREQELLNEVYLGLQTRLKEAEVQYAVAPDEARVIDAALIPTEPVSPRPLVTMILATILGLMLGVAAAVGRESIDTSVRSPGEVEAAAGGIPVVGMIPRMRLGSGRMGRLRTRWQQHLPPTVGRLPGPSDPLVTGSESNVEAAEAYRALRASISYGVTGGAPRVLVLTSPRRGDGTSLSAANLAVSLARQGSRILLVDADLREGELYRRLAAARAPGLTEILQGSAKLGGVLQQVDLESPNGASLSFLSCGSRPANPSDLIASPAIADLVAEMRNQFDRVIIDAAALHQVADGARLGALADATLLVVRAGATDRSLLQQTVTRLRRMRVPIGGLILNDVELSGTELHALPNPFEPHAQV